MPRSSTAPWPGCSARARRGSAASAGCGVDSQTPDRGAAADGAHLRRNPDSASGATTVTLSTSGGCSMSQSYASGTSSVPLLGETIGENLERTAADFPDHEAVVVPFQQVRLAYATFDELVDQVARGLMAFGLEKGERVGIWSPNSLEWLLLQYASAKAGAVLVNINPAYRTHELAYVLQQSACRVLVAATEFKTSNYVEMVTEVRAE